jgi:hypothetical protein
LAEGYLERHVPGSTAWLNRVTSEENQMATEKKIKEKVVEAKPKDPIEKAKVEAKTEATTEAKSDAPKNYSRGEGQKAVTQAYKDNWNAIFNKKKR